MNIFDFDLQLFAIAWSDGDAGTPNVNPINVTTQQSMSPTMKVFYDTTLLENAREAMIFTQLGRKQPMKGNKVEWRKFNTFAKALTPLVEGVIPTGQTFGMSKIEAEITQHGDYTAVSDRLEMESYDDVIFGATEEMGATSGETYDTLTRNIIVGGNSVAYGGGKTSRTALTASDLLTPALVNKANTWLKKNKAPKFEGQTYGALIHPSVAEDLRNSDAWLEAHKYADPTPIFTGEIGVLHGVRFIESNACKIFRKPLTAGSITLTVKTTLGSAGKNVTVKEAITSADALALAGQSVVIGSNTYTLASATAGSAGSAVITTTENVSTTDGTADNKISSVDAGKDGVAVYATLFMGKDAFGVLDPEGEGMEMIVKGKGEIGGPLEQFSTIGYKFCHGAKILYEERMLRVETGSSYSAVDEEN